MDIEAKPIGNDLWLLTDLLGRTVGTLVVSSGGVFVEHDKNGVLESLPRGPYSDLSAALAVIEKKLGGACRLVTP